MFSRKKRELMKTPSISKKNRAGSPSPQPSGTSLRPAARWPTSVWARPCVSCVRSSPSIRC
ncbi:ARHGAP45 isoform 6 [Pongo abelii]|uniref:ARHGAP45 isoform 6 n=1 Tax=Pongo abelii TaxID=9601 RepID=A0A2J8R9X1_PONAB|nr:ARHGAP45 isoform 6 [Pongo abelii]